LRTNSRRARLIARRFAILACLLAAMCAHLAAAESPARQVSLQEYIAALDRCSAALGTSANDPAALRKVRMSLPSQWSLNTGGQRYTIDTDWLADGLARVENASHGDRNAVRRLQAQITAHRDAAESFDKAASSQRLEDSRARLNHILDAREFASIHGPTKLDSLRARFYDWIERQLGKIFDKLGQRKALGNIVAWTVIVLTAVLLILWAVRATARVGARAGMDLRGASATGQDSTFWLRGARDAAARGDYRAAIHAAYWAAIARLEEMKALPEDRSRTPRESLRLIRRESAEYAPLSQLTRRFELVWYGYRSADSADWSDAMQQLETLGCLRSSTPAISAS